MQSPPFPRYLVPPRSKYSPQHHDLKHPPLPFLPQCQRPSFAPIQNKRQICGKAIIILYSECVFVAIDIQHAMRQRHTLMFPDRMYIIFPHYLINTTIFGRKNYWTWNVYFDFLYNFFFRDISHSNKNWALEYHKCPYPLFLSDFKATCTFSTEYKKK